jgi:hypothetical protein
MAALLCVANSPSHAQRFGDARWCAVQQIGAGAIEWDCVYRSAQECAPAVVAGNRGYCNPNPAWRPSPPEAGAPAPGRWR